MIMLFFFFNDTATTEIYTLSLHDALPICRRAGILGGAPGRARCARAERAGAGERAVCARGPGRRRRARSEEHTSELQSRQYLVCRLLLEKKNTTSNILHSTSEPLYMHVFQ